MAAAPRKQRVRRVAQIAAAVGRGVFVRYVSLAAAIANSFSELQNGYLSDLMNSMRSVTSSSLRMPLYVGITGL